MGRIVILCALVRFSLNYKLYFELAMERLYGVKMVTLTEKLMNLKYELLMGCLGRDIRILRYL